MVEIKCVADSGDVGWLCLIYEAEQKQGMTFCMIPSPQLEERIEITFEDGFWGFWLFERLKERSRYQILHQEEAAAALRNTEIN